MCKHPLKGFPHGVTEKGKTHYIITPYKVHHLEKVKGLWTKCYESFISPSCQDYITEFEEIPCGRCIECRLSYSREWANRMMFEAMEYDPNKVWFVTLTYDDNNLTYQVLENECEIATLMPEDMTKFIKRLRRKEEYHNDNKLRYFYCGEYGTKTLRPHYHMIVYGLSLDDLVLYGKSKSGFPLYESKYLSDTWKKGYVLVSPVTWETCAYTARYVLKKTDQDKTDREMLEESGVTPEFVRMSRNPGLGKAYYEKKGSDLWKFDSIYLSTQNGGMEIKPPKYFERLLEIEDSELYENVKDNRKEIARYRRFMKMSQTNLSYSEILAAEELKLKNSIKSLRRDKI